MPPTDPNESLLYTADAVREGDSLLDVRIEWPGGRTWHMLGRGGAQRELRLLECLSPSARDSSPDSGPACPEHLPVFIGSGTGAALLRFIEMNPGRPAAVVDREHAILAVTGIREKLHGNTDILWVDSHDALRELTRWQAANGGLRLIPVCNPLYLRLDPDYYRDILDKMKASASYNFWERARYPKFREWPPRVLLITSKYFLMGEIIRACERLGVPHHLLHIDDDELGRTEFVEQLLEAVISFRPDFVFTINHLGVDREGVLSDLLGRLQLPLASWFVDNPHLILYLYNSLVSDWTSIYTWDADNIASLKDMGFSHVEYLSLGVDAKRFVPRPHDPGHPLSSDVAFVGNSMVHKVVQRMKAGKFPRELLLHYRDIARDFAESEERSVRAFFANNYSRLATHFEALGETERKLAFEAMLTWEATRQYRTTCVAQTLPFNPLIAGDDGWKLTFRNETRPWRWHHELNYYEDLPRFYPLHAVNFNCTSKQMKGAVNQRIFDAPATGAFILTDWRVQIENLFEPGTEVICYNEPEEAGELIRRFLDHPAERRAVAQAARRRILAEHTYEHRVETLLHSMKRIYGQAT